MRNITLHNKTYALHDFFYKIASAANQNQPVHRTIETSSFMSLLRAQLELIIICFPIWTVNRAHQLDDQVADQSLQSINHEY